MSKGKVWSRCKIRVYGFEWSLVLTCVHASTMEMISEALERLALMLALPEDVATVYNCMHLREMRMQTSISCHLTRKQT